MCVERGCTGSGRAICDRLFLIFTIKRVDGSTAMGFAKSARPTPRMPINTGRDEVFRFFFEHGGFYTMIKGMTQKTQLFRLFQSDPWVLPVVGYIYFPDE